MTRTKNLIVSLVLILLALSRAEATELQEISKRLDSLYLSASYIEGEQIIRQALSSASISESDKVELRLQLGIFTQELGKYADAEEAYLKAFTTYSNSENSDQLLIASVLSRLSVLYAEQGRYDAARNAAKRQFDIYNTTLGKENGFTALASVVLASQYIFTREYEAAQKLLKDFEPVIIHEFGIASKEAARFYEALGRYYFATNDYLSSENALIKARASARNTPGDRHPLTARIALSLCRTRLTLGNADSGLANVNDALAIALKASGPRHPFTAECQIARGSVSEAHGKYAEAFSAFSLGVDIFSEATKENFRYTSERERLAFLNLIGEQFARIGSATLRSSAIYPQATQTYYDALLFQKGVVITSLQAQTRLLSRLGDTKTLELLHRLADLRTRRSRFARNAPELPEHTLTTIDSIEASLNLVEKELAKRSDIFTDLMMMKRIGWKNIQQSLGKKEVCVELSRFPYYDGERRTDTAFYAALTFGENDTTRPRLAILGRADVIEDSTVIRQYFRAMSKRSKRTPAMGALVTKVLWSGLEGYFGDANRIIISPDGIYHQLSLGAMRNDKGELLLERYGIRYVISTRDILQKTPLFDSSKSFVAFASPDFNYSLNKNSESESLSPLEPLPQTSIEAVNISEEFKKARYAVELNLDSNASELKLRQAAHPLILHLATHATFADNHPKESIVTLGTNQEIESPLLSSKLYLAGANKTLLDNSYDPNNDGILTAMEATELDLNGTDLVTLSACESGRGAVQPGEGVFGLTRAFLVAGAQNILLSLWQVPDKETKELMIYFYRELLSGKSKADALRNAQLYEREIVRKRYGEDIPSYWAAFILIGGR